MGNTLPVSVSGTTVGGSNAMGGASCGGGGTHAPDATYQWTAPADGPYTISTAGSEFDTLLYVRDAACAGTELACNNDSGGTAQSQVTLQLSGGQTVIIVVDGYGDAAGTYQLAITGPRDYPVAGACVQFNLESALPVAVTGTTVGTTNAMGGASCGDGGTDAPDATYQWTAPGDGWYTFSTAGSAFDTILYVRDAACDGNELACDDDSNGTVQSEVTVPLTGGQTVVIVVDGYGGVAGAYELTITRVEPGDCCGSTVSSGCTTVACAACVCDADAYCCAGQWDDTCAGEVFDQCQSDCGCPTPTPLPTDAPSSTPTETPPPPSTATPRDTCPQYDLGTIWTTWLTGSTDGRPDSMGGSGCGDGTGAPDMSYRFTAPADGTYVVEMIDASFNAILSLRAGGCGGAELTCTTFSNEYKTVRTTLVAGDTVVFTIDGVGTDSGTFTLWVFGPPTPPDTRTPTPTATPRLFGIQVPVDGARVNVSPITVSGVAIEVLGVVVNGVTATLTEATFSASVPLLEGLNTIQATAKTAAGPVTDTIAITLDTVAPAAPNIQLIVTGLFSSGEASIIGFAGSVEADSFVTVTNTRTAQTVTVSADHTGGFSAGLPAQAGDTVSIVVTDQAGNTGLPGTTQIGSIVVGVAATAFDAASSGGQVTVRGTLQSLPNGTVGVTANGIPGLVEGNQFVIRVPVDPSQTSVTMLVRDFSGLLGAVAIPITVPAGAPPPAIVLRATHAAGLVPLTTGFTYSSPVSAVHLSLDADGDGTADADETTIDTFSYVYTQPGFYLPRLTVTDAGGNSYTAVGIVHVADPTAMDARLQPVWQGVKGAVSSGDFTTAMQYVHSDSAAGYQALWPQLPPTGLANVDEVLPSIHLLKVGFGNAEYEMLRDEGGQTFSYGAWFELDQDGLWRLRSL